MKWSISFICFLILCPYLISINRLSEDFSRIFRLQELQGFPENNVQWLQLQVHHVLFDFHLISQEIEIFKIKCYFMVCKGLLVMLIIKTAYSCMGLHVDLFARWFYDYSNCSCISAFLRAPLWFPQWVKNIFGDLTPEKSCQLATNRFEKKIIQSNQHFFNGFIKTKNEIGALFLCL